MRMFGYILGAMLAVLSTVELSDYIEMANTAHEGVEAYHGVQDIKGISGFAMVFAGITNFEAFDPSLGTEIDNPLALKLHIFPDDMVHDGQPRNPWGGRIILGHTSARQMYFYTERVPGTACASLVAANMLGFPYAAVNSTITAPAAAAKAGCIDGDNTVLLSFDRVYPEALLPDGQ